MKNSKIKFRRTDKFLFIVLMMISFLGFSQEDKKIEKELKQSKEILSEANINIQEDKFVEGEADYRKAIALNPKSETGKYNLGNAYYGKKKNAEAMLRYKQAGAIANDKSEKHKAFHNLGNTYMNEKKYTEAVEAYKNALRNNPNDDESRYNLALAKDMLEKNPPQDDKGDDDKNKDNKDKDNQDKKDKQEDQDKKDKGDEGDDKDQKDKGDQEDENKDGDKKDEDKGKPDKPKDEEGDKPQQQQPVPGQLSPQQVKSLLEAMNNEEKKVQDKVNAQKEKGAKVKSSKDW